MQPKQPVPSYQDQDKSILPVPTFVTTENQAKAAHPLDLPAFVTPPSSTSFALEIEPAFLDDEGPSAHIPPHVTTTNIRELYGWEPGESLDEAIARSHTGG